MPKKPIERLAFSFYKLFNLSRSLISDLSNFFGTNVSNALMYFMIYIFKLELKNLLGEKKISKKDWNRIEDFWTAQDVLVDNSDEDMTNDKDAERVISDIDTLIHKAIVNSNK